MGVSKFKEESNDFSRRDLNLVGELKFEGEAGTPKDTPINK